MKVAGMIVVSLRGVNCRFRSLPIQVSPRVDYERKTKIYDDAFKI